MQDSLGLRLNVVKSEVPRVGANLDGAGTPRDISFLTPSEFSELPASGLIDPRRIRFSQDEISPYFRPPHGTVDDFIQGLKNGTIDPSNITPIRIVEKDGLIHSLDNRRLYSFQEAGVQIPYTKLDVVPKRQLFKFDTQNEGVSVFVRPRKD
jgi:hypothetical protein